MSSGRTGDEQQGVHSTDREDGHRPEVRQYRGVAGQRAWRDRLERELRKRIGGVAVLGRGLIEAPASGIVEIEIRDPDTGVPMVNRMVQAADGRCYGNACSRNRLVTTISSTAKETPQPSG